MKKKSKRKKSFHDLEALTQVRHLEERMHGLMKAVGRVGILVQQQEQRLKRIEAHIHREQRGMR